MFNKKESISSSNNNANSTINIINSGTNIVGDINSTGDIRIDGDLKGTIKTKGKVVVGKNAKIEGEIICSNADIAGVVSAKLSVDKLLVLKSTAKLSGDISINKLAIEPGANFSGKCSMKESVIKESIVKESVLKDIKHVEKKKTQEKTTPA